MRKSKKRFRTARVSAPNLDFRSQQPTGVFAGDLGDGSRPETNLNRTSRSRTPGPPPFFPLWLSRNAKLVITSNSPFPQRQRNKGSAMSRGTGAFEGSAEALKSCLKRPGKQLEDKVIIDPGPAYSALS